jgi:hypothetical protein
MPQDNKYGCIDKTPLNAILNDKIVTAASHMKSGDIMSEISNVKAAFKVSAIWKQPELRIAFLDGSDHQKEWVKSNVQKHLEPLCSRIKFTWGVPPYISDIRISFLLPGQAWSLIGNEALTEPKNNPTMNLGWIDDDVSNNGPKYKGTAQVILHEFGHAMGMIHEHQTPFGNPLVWNKPVVYSELQRTNGWDAAAVDNNMFHVYGDYECCKKANSQSPPDLVKITQCCLSDQVNGSQYDPDSIMLYMFPPKWLISGPPTKANTAYSELDKQWMRNYYGDGIKESFESKDDYGILGLYIFGIIMLIIFIVILSLILVRLWKKDRQFDWIP